MILEISDKTAAREIAGKLLEIEAIKLRVENPFIWSSGWNSPIYCDNRVALSYPLLRTKIRNLLVEQIKQNFPEVEAISGVATAGIAQGALIAEELGLPFSYVRSKPKGHGMENLIEGRVTEGAKTVVIEDLISTGGSSLKAIEALKLAIVEVLGLGAIFSYDFPIANENFENDGVDAFILSDYNFLLEEALKTGYIKQSQVGSLKDWRKNPGQWKK